MSVSSVISCVGSFNTDLLSALRLHPVVPVNARFAVTDTVLPVGGGKDDQSPVFVPKGTTVRYNLYSMHCREDFYGLDAHVYRPERWEKLRTGWEYLPFNGWTADLWGSTICPH
jgi:cytochrome P450